eukprot:TRINITY_DN4574_c0_g1_i1.p2 TRINITY_DN4574_c0_g1~~TRINITY_DN4574_c0_g1_i1.p2  ORF type:complete len:365 (+),score=145.48 TRINITY_DN4574_c0_g1_i1:107-1201(+)
MPLVSPKRVSGAESLDRCWDQLRLVEQKLEQRTVDNTALKACLQREIEETASLEKELQRLRDTCGECARCKEAAAKELQSCEAAASLRTELAAREKELSKLIQQYRAESTRTRDADSWAQQQRLLEEEKAAAVARAAELAAQLAALQASAKEDAAAKEAQLAAALRSRDEAVAAAAAKDAQVAAALRSRDEAAAAAKEAEAAAAGRARDGAAAAAADRAAAATPAQLVPAGPIPAPPAPAAAPTVWAAELDGDARGRVQAAERGADAARRQAAAAALRVSEAEKAADAVAARCGAERSLLLVHVESERAALIAAHAEELERVREERRQDRLTIETLRVQLSHARAAVVRRRPRAAVVSPPMPPS